MGPAGGIVSFLIIWWTVLFMVLPMRVKGQWEDRDGYVQGTERGAPVNPEIWLKFQRTTWVSALIWVVVYWVVSSGVINFNQ